MESGLIIPCKRFLLCTCSFYLQTLVFKTLVKMQKEKEVWKSIPNYEGLYSISTFAKVKSLQRIGYQGREITEKILKKSINTHGYNVVTICNRQGKPTIKVHVLMAIVFKNHIPGSRNEKGELLVSDHIDNNKLNDHVDNIQVITARKNTSKDQKGGSSEYIGVFWCNTTSRWMSRIYIKGKYKYIGTFHDELEAAKAYQNKLKTI